MKKKKPYLPHPFATEKSKAFYLAHPFDARRQIRLWEKWFEKESGIILINPFYDSPGRKYIKLIDQGMEVKKPSPKKIIHHDLRLIEAANDGLVAVINGELSYGTIMEIVYAKEIFKKNVYSIITNGKKDHHWLRYHSDEIFTSFNDFEDWYVNNFPQ